MRNQELTAIEAKIYKSIPISDEEHNKLRKALKTGDKQEKIYVARLLSRLKCKDDLKFILPLLYMDNNTLSLIEAVASYGNEEVKKLESFLEDKEKKSKYLRENLIRIFVFTSSPEYIYIFIKYLNDDFNRVRDACIHGITKLSAVEAIEPLKKLILNEKDISVKKYAQATLEMLEQQHRTRV